MATFSLEYVKHFESTTWGMSSSLAVVSFQRMIGHLCSKPVFVPCSGPGTTSEEMVEFIATAVKRDDAGVGHGAGWHWNPSA